MEKQQTIECKEYRTHNCKKVNIEDKKVKLIGWLARKRDHGGKVFIDLRDYYGEIQIVFDSDTKNFNEIHNISTESVLAINGEVINRSEDTINSKIFNGDIEVQVVDWHIESASDALPIQINNSHEYPDELRLKYRYLDMRNNAIKNNILLRTKVIKRMREIMWSYGFNEYQTPILTASSPEGARDFVVPSRMHKGKFYALPQAPQQFKQLLMVAGMDKYFQIAPCFRDEDSRSDRSPADFYQLDIEMSFITQKEIFILVEDLISIIFKEFSTKKFIGFEKIKYNDAIESYASDKPDLRNPIKIYDATEIFLNSQFTVFANNAKKGMTIKIMCAKNTANKPRSFFDNLTKYAQDTLKSKGLAYITYDANQQPKGPLVKFLTPEEIKQLESLCGATTQDTMFFISDNKKDSIRICHNLRCKLADDLELIDNDTFHFCWITDFPYFEEDNGNIDFSHNPFSMPQGGLEALNTDNLLDIMAHQYDLVCNGIELASGAIRAHKPEIIYKAFELTGKSREYVDNTFAGLVTSLKYGAPPHGGIAPGIDRIIMMLADTENIREVICFPLNQKGEDLMMNAPSEIDNKHLNLLGLSKITKVKK